MYIHIGNNNIVNTKSIIGFFDYKILKNNIKENVINREQIKEDKIKSIIVVEEHEIIKNYISNISTNALAKRKL